MTVSSIESSVQKTYEWLRDLREIGGFEHEAEAYSALRASLQTLRDRLAPGEAADLGSELPMVIRGIYFEGWKPEGRRNKERTRQEFEAHIQERLRGATQIQPGIAARATFRLLERKISSGEIKDVKAMLPAQIREELWSSEIAAK